MTEKIPKGTTAKELWEMLGEVRTFLFDEHNKAVKQHAEYYCAKETGDADSYQVEHWSGRKIATWVIYSNFCQWVRDLVAEKDEQNRGKQ